MKRMICGLCCLWIALVWASPIGISWGAEETVKIGALFPMTGPIAYAGRDSMRGLEIAKDMVNEKGGILGKKIEFVIGDAKDPKMAMSETERLISVEKVKIVIGTYSSPRGLAASEVANKHKIIFWETGATTDKITERGFKYLFRTQVRGSDYGYFGAEFINQVAGAKLGKNPKDLRVAVIYEDELFGISCAEPFLKKAKEIGLNIIFKETYSSKSLDLSGLVMRLRDQKPEVVYAATLVPDFLLFWRQAREQKFSPPVLIGNGTWASQEIPDTFKEDCNYLFNIQGETPNINLNRLNEEGKKSHSEFVTRFHKKWPNEPGPFASELASYLGTWILFMKVLPAAKSFNPDDVREAALSLQVPEGGTCVGYGVKFAGPDNPNAGQNLLIKPVMLQYHKKDMVCVWPEFLGVAKPLIPMPNWGNRGM